MSKIPLELLVAAKDLFKPKNNHEWRTLGYKQLAYVPLSLFTGSFFYSAFAHGMIALASIIRKPSDSYLKEMKETYELPHKPKDKFNVFAAGASGTFMGGLLMASPELCAHFYDVMTSTDSTLQEYSQELLFSGVLYETLRVSYVSFRNLIPMLLQYDSTSKVKETLHPYLQDELGESMLSIQPVIMHTIKKNPKKALSMIIDEYFDKGIRPYDMSTPLSIELSFQQLGDDPLASFVNSLIGMGMEDYRPYFFKKAVDVAIENKDLSALSLLGLYEYTTTHTTRVFKEQVRVLKEKKHITQELLGEGTFTNTYTVGDSTDDLARLVLVQKISSDTKRLQEKYELHQLLSSLKYVNPSIDLHISEGIGVLSEVRMRKPTFYERVGLDHSLYDEAYLVMERIREQLQNSTFVFEPLDIEKKYLTQPLLSSTTYEASIHEAAELFADLGEYEPILDFHAHNLFVDDDTIVNIDIENKGSGSNIFDIINLLYYTPDAVNAQTLEVYTDSFLKTYQEKIQKEDAYMQALFLRGLGLRVFSHTNARYTPQGIVDTRNARLVLETAGHVFENYAQQSYQKRIAKQQLDIVESLIKAI